MGNNSLLVNFMTLCEPLPAGTYVCTGWCDACIERPDGSDDAPYIVHVELFSSAEREWKAMNAEAATWETAAKFVNETRSDIVKIDGFDRNHLLFAIMNDAKYRKLMNILMKGLRDARHRNDRQG